MTTTKRAKPGPPKVLTPEQDRAANAKRVAAHRARKATALTKATVALKLIAQRLDGDKMAWAQEIRAIALIGLG